MKLYIVIFIILGTNSYLNACTYYYLEYLVTVPAEQIQTITLIQTKEENVKSELEKYKEALKEKKKRMTEMLRMLMGIEALMMKNQVSRKEVLKHWENVSQTHTLQN